MGCGANNRQGMSVNGFAGCTVTDEYFQRKLFSAICHRRKSPKKLMRASSHSRPMYSFISRVR